MTMARLCDVSAQGGPADGVVIATGERWASRHVWNVEVEGTWHRYVKKARADVAVWEGENRWLKVLNLRVEDAVADAYVSGGGAHGS